MNVTNQIFFTNRVLKENRLGFYHLSRFIFISTSIFIYCSFGQLSVISHYLGVNWVYFQFYNLI